MLRPLLASLLVFALLSGCASPPDASSPSSDGPPAGTQPVSSAAAPGTPAPAPPSSRPASPPTAAPRAANATAKPQPETTRFDGTWTAGFYAPVVRDGEANGDIPYSLELDGSETGVLVEMEWTPSTPASDSMGVYVAVPELGVPEPVGSAAGTGPLRLLLEGLEAGEYVVNARASGPQDAAGAFVVQDYTLFVTVFRGIPFDPAFTALE